MSVWPSFPNRSDTSGWCALILRCVISFICSLGSGQIMVAMFTAIDSASISAVHQSQGLDRYLADGLGLVTWDILCP